MHRDHGEVPRDALCALCGQMVQGYRCLNHSVNSVRNVLEAAFHVRLAIFQFPLSSFDFRIADFPVSDFEFRFSNFGFQ